MVRTTCKSEWLSPRLENQRAEAAAFARAEQTLRCVEREKASNRSHELQQLELVAAFMRLEAAEEKQRGQLTARMQKKQERERKARIEADYHRPEPQAESLAGGVLPQDLRPEELVAATRAARQRQREDLDLSLIHI